MKRILLAVGICALTGTAVAGPLGDACLARGTWNEQTCDCMQGVADQMLPADKQDLAAAYFGRQITSQQIAVEQGAATAQDFLNSVAEFMAEATKECGAP